jgi:hypothetical protein
MGVFKKRHPDIPMNVPFTFSNKQPLPKKASSSMDGWVDLRNGWMGRFAKVDNGFG